jgi:type IX secretion system PorP/SprF family membrane protein
MIASQPDEYLYSNKFSVIIPDFNFGVYYISQQTFLGFSASQLLQTAVYFGNYQDRKVKLKRNYNLMGGYRFMLQPDFTIEPGFQLKTTDQWFVQVDVGCRLYYKRNLWGGIAFRTGSTLVFTFGVKYDDFYFGYAYDYSFNGLQTYSYGTHELSISLKFKEYERKYHWMERF